MLVRSHSRIAAFCLLIVAMTVFTSARAQALPAWMISPFENPIGPKLPVELAAKAEGTLGLLTEVSKKATAISCSTLAGDEALFEGEGKGSGRLLFSGCTTSIGGTTQPACKPHSAGLAEGTIRTNALKSQLVAHEGQTLDQIKPLTGETFVKIVQGAEGESECSIGEFLPVSGVLYAKDANGKFESEAVTHLLAEGPLTDLWSYNKTAEHKVTLDGSVELSMAGEHAGREWSGLGS